MQRKKENQLYQTSCSRDSQIFISEGNVALFLTFMIPVKKDGNLQFPSTSFPLRIDNESFFSIHEK